MVGPRIAALACLLPLALASWRAEMRAMFVVYLVLIATGVGAPHTATGVEG